MRSPEQQDVHLIFCPSDHLDAQARAGEFIASLNPSIAVLGTVQNSHTPYAVNAEIRGFYDSVTGFERDMAEDDELSVAQKLKQAYGFDEALSSLAQAAIQCGTDIVEFYPFYSLVMQLRDTGIEVDTPDVTKNDLITYGQEGPLTVAAYRIKIAQDNLFKSTNGVDDYEAAIADYRAVRRNHNELMRSGIREFVQQSEDNPVVIVTDNSGIYDLRKEQLSPNGSTFVHSFGSKEFQSTRVLSKQDYAPSVLSVDIGIEFEEGSPTEIECHEVVRIYSLVVAINNELKTPDSETVIIDLLVSALYRKMSRQGIYQIFKNAANSITDRQNYDDDSEMTAILNMGLRSQLLRDLKELAQI